MENTSTAILRRRSYCNSFMPFLLLFITAKESVENALPVHAINFMLLNFLKNRSEGKPGSPP